MSTNNSTTTTNNSTTTSSLNYRTRILGSSYTVWTIEDKPIVWCVSVQHQSPRLVADAVPIQPLNYLRPAEIAVPRAISAGEIVMNVIETYGNKPWDYLNNLFPQANSYGKNGTPYSDLADVMRYMQDQLTDIDAQSSIKLYRIIRTPGSNGAAQPWYVTEFTGVRITDIRENETATTNAMQNNLEITCMYTAKIDSVFDGSTGFSGATQTLDKGPALDKYAGGVGFDY
jgi:hypothetical protein